MMRTISFFGAAVQHLFTCILMCNGNALTLSLVSWATMVWITICQQIQHHSVQKSTVDQQCCSENTALRSCPNRHKDGCKQQRNSNTLQRRQDAAFSASACTISRRPAEWWLVFYQCIYLLKENLDFWRSQSPFFLKILYTHYQRYHPSYFCKRVVILIWKKIRCMHVFTVT